MKNYLQEKSYNIIALLIIGIAVCWFTFLRPPIRQSVEVLDVKTQYELIREWEREEVYREIDCIYPRKPYIKKVNPYCTGKPLFKLTTSFGSHEWEKYGDEDFIKKVKCEEYANALKRIKQDRDEKIAEKKAENKADELENIDCN